MFGEWREWRSAWHTGDVIDGSGVSFYGKDQYGCPVARTYDGRTFVKNETGTWVRHVRRLRCGCAAIGGESGVQQQ